MSFGFSIGDFLAVLQLSNKIRKDFSGAPEQLKGIAKDVKNLDLVLQDVDDFLAGHDLAPKQADSLREIYGSCADVLKDIEKALNRYSLIGDKPKASKDRVKRVWMRLTWPPDEIRDFRSRITSNLASLNAFIENTIRLNVTKIVERQDELKSQEILDWLSPPDYAAQHASHLQGRLPGTGQWLLDTEEYQKWTQATSDVLFLHGIPGAGKTVLSAIVIEKLLFQCQADPTSTIAYFYCDFNRRNDQQLDRILLSILRQLVQELSDMPDSITKLYDKHKKNKTTPNAEEASSALLMVTKSYKKLYMIVDALDECSDTKCQRELITRLLELGSNETNILITSRPLPHITERFRRHASLEIRASTEDITTYVNGNLGDLPAFVSRNAELQASIRSTIVDAVDGMFLLAKLHIESLKGQRSPKQLRNTMKSFKQGADAYTTAYSKTMERISSQKGYAELAIEALSWVFHANRPITTTELLHALAIEIDEPDFDEEGLPDLNDTLSACCGLLKIEEESQVIRLVHYTTEEYFKGSGSVWLSNGHDHICRNCLAYLCINAFNGGFCNNPKGLRKRFQDYPFYTYASQNWGYHAHGLKEMSLVETFFSMSKHVEAAGQALLAKDYFSHVSMWPPEGINGLHIAAYFGSIELVRRALSIWKINDQDIEGWNPLLYAAHGGHLDLVRTLLENGAYIDHSTTEFENALMFAVSNGHTNVVAVLVEKGIHINRRNRSHNSALSRAIGSGQKDIVDILVKQGANLEVKDINTHTPLISAVHYLQVDIATMLIKAGANLEATDTLGRTAFWYAAVSGSERLMNLLLENGAFIDSSTNLGESPLTNAVGEGRIDVARFLIDNGASLNHQDSQKYTALQRAVDRREEELVALLLEKGADVDVHGSISALWRAVRHGSEKITTLLLDRGADRMFVTSDGVSTAQIAAMGGHLGTVRLLLEYEPRLEHMVAPGPGQPDYSTEIGSSNPHRLRLLSIADKEGRNILYYAIKGGNFEILDYLLQSGADTKNQDKFNQTFLHYASQSGSLDILTRCLEADPADYQEHDSCWSLLHWVCRNGTFEMIKLLVDRGSSLSAVTTTNTQGKWTPLDIAVYWNNENLISKDGTLRSDHPWIQVVESNLVTLQSDSILLPHLTNKMDRGRSSTEWKCDECKTVSILAIYFLCCRTEYRLEDDWGLVHP